MRIKLLSSEKQHATEEDYGVFSAVLHYLQKEIECYILHVMTGALCGNGVVENLL